MKPAGFLLPAMGTGVAEVHSQAQLERGDVVLERLSAPWSALDLRGPRGILGIVQKS